ncbi:MAG: UvrD-helicase domain-containing protein [Candidatus Lambdaproteobacteria bacterium]|nr:UvrD-helicase domain-containing protein [Candidatus Lambdaproteobacteria bacterium]
MAFDLDSLNDRQREAVLATEGAVLVLAGAGSGKTRVITSRIAHLMRNRKVPPEQILAVTFTNKAANEMAQRVKVMAPGSGNGSAGRPLICTFHALGVRMLRRTIQHLGYRPNFVIYDDQDQLQLVRGLMEDGVFESDWMQPKDALFALQAARGQGLAAADLLRDEHEPDRRLGRLLAAYEDTLRRMNAVDFEDLLRLPLRLCREHPVPAREFLGQFRYLLVDEYQDTNHTQYDLVREIARPHGNVCVVGDDDQSIYRWRGAEPENIKKFERDFAGVHTVHLEQNYRSTDIILKAANQVITHNADRKPKRLWGRQGEGAPLEWLEADSERQELEAVVNHLRSLRLRRDAKLSDFAILYRSNHQSRGIEELLREEGIPYNLVGGTRFYDRREVKDALAYLKVIANPDDEVSLFRIVNFPRRGIGRTSQTKLADVAAHQGRPALQIMAEAGRYADFAGATGQSMQHFAELVTRYRRRFAEGPLGATFRELLAEVGFHRALEKEKTDAKSREKTVGLIYELEQATDHFGRTREEPSLKSYLEHIALFAMPQDTDERDKPLVTLMTVHGAKGLEFPYVYVIGMADEVFPNKRALDEGQEEEERRLAYVAITRARRALVFSMARARKRYGETLRQRPSRFLLEIDPALFAGPAPGAAGAAHPGHQEQKTKEARERFFENVRKLRETGQGGPG